MTTIIKIGKDLTLAIPDTDISFEDITETFLKIKENKKYKAWLLESETFFYRIPRKIIEENYVLILKDK